MGGCVNARKNTQLRDQNNQHSSSRQAGVTRQRGALGQINGITPELIPVTGHSASLPGRPRPAASGLASQSPPHPQQTILFPPRLSSPLPSDSSLPAARNAATPSQQVNKAIIKVSHTQRHDSTTKQGHSFSTTSSKIIKIQTFMRRAKLKFSVYLMTKIILNQYSNN